MEAHPSGGVASLSLRHGVRCVPDADSNVEDVLVAVGEQIGFDNIISASRMNKAVVVFLKDESLVSKLIETSVWVNGAFTVVSPLVSQSVRVTISNVPPFILNSDIEKELLRFGKMASEVKMIPLRCKNEALKHVLSFRRQVFMFLDQQTLDISFRIKHEGKSYMIYASTGNMKCFECGDVGHKKIACPHNKTQLENNVATDIGVSVQIGENVEASEEPNKTKIDENKENKNADEGTSKQRKRNSTVSGVVSEKRDNPCVDINDGDHEDEESLRSKLPKVAINDAQNTGQICLSQLTDAEEQDDMEDDDRFSEASDIPSQFSEDQLYTVTEVNDFLDATFGKTIEISEFFPDAKKFLQSAVKIQQTASYDELSRRKRFRLKKIVTKLRRKMSLEKGLTSP